MALSARIIRSQLHMLKPLLSGLSLDSVRRWQERMGQLMAFLHREQVVIKTHTFDCFDAAWILPRDKRRGGVILYLHGGGYAAGDLDFATGFGSTLAVDHGSRVLCPAYRLAPEHPYPAALEDALTAYKYLLQKGYDAHTITLCGESAGGGLCYSLCLKLRQLGLPLPGGIIAISPWTDLTLSGPSYEENKTVDPSMTEDMLRFYAQQYGGDPTDPYISPLFGDLTDLPPSLIFVGGDEIMRSDAEAIHEKLMASGCTSQLSVAPERWHAYVLYGLEENRADTDTISRFLDRHTAPANKLRWLRLDNAAKIYPASISSDWSSVFRLSATLKETVDPQVLSSALDITVRRFPSICARLRKGFFWYYLEQIPAAPKLLPEGSCPVTNIPRRELRKCAFRVFVYDKRIAVEFFHSLTDGSGGLVFLKTLVAEYLHQKHGIAIPAQEGVLGRLEEPREEELEDSFLRHAGPVAASRKENTAWQLTGTPEPDGHRNLVCLRVESKQLLEAAHAYGVSATAFLAAALLQALTELQKEKVPVRALRKPLKVQIPVNLRRLFGSTTLRNFALYVNPEIDPRLGDFTFRELCLRVHHHMGMEVIPQQMRARIAANVGSEKLLIVKILPLFLKNIALRIAFNTVGERKVCLAMSNLGAVKVPEVMAPYIDRFDFILGAPALTPVNCGIVSFGDTMNINFTRSIRESELELHFFKVLQRHGIAVTAESNTPI